NYGDARDFVATFTVSDGEAEVKARVEIQVLHTNQAPIIAKTFSGEKMVRIKENEILKYSFSAKDPDGDKLTYEWKLDNHTLGYDGSGEHYFDFHSAGDHRLEAAAGDGEKYVFKDWIIRVDNVKRSPEVLLPPLTVKEGDKVGLELPTKDEDDDALTYTFVGAPFDTQGEWQTDYDDAGIYNVLVGAHNGQFTYWKETKLTVLDVDRTPSWVDLPGTININEGELLKLDLNTVDPDGDKVKVTIGGLPEGATFINDTLAWTPSYDTIVRTVNFVGNFLNALRLERFFLSSEEFPLNVTACGKVLCTSRLVTVKVHNQNRAPEFVHAGDIEDITVKETELARVNLKAVDPDGDVVRYYYTSPLGRRSGKWNPTYGDKGSYEIYVTATDGYFGNTLPLKLNVLKNERAPTLTVRDSSIKVNEGQQFMFKVSTSDPDGDNLTLRLDNIPPGASFKEGVFLWTPGYDIVKNKTEGWWNNLVGGEGYFNRKFSTDKTVLWLSFAASDGAMETVHPVKVTVKNVNHAPEIIDYLPIGESTVQVGKPVIFHVAAKDSDGDKLNYQWEFSGLGEKDLIGTDTLERTFTSVGEKKVKVEVSDGRDEVEREWKVTIVGEPVVASEPVLKQGEEEPFTIKVYVISQGNKIVVS
ncbi:hypothetical protein HZC32_02935, partial [Candidatus Woesearchaeota archaeon]|nr:hypothetical protein [Candidatus Woesearchaeota archaeon]